MAKTTTKAEETRARLLALPLKLLQEVTPPYGMHSVPERSNGCFLGLVNIRGEIVPIYDMDGQYRGVGLPRLQAIRNDVDRKAQLLARLGADVVRIEHPRDGESGRGASPFMIDATGRKAGATFLRNALNKRSVGIDLKQPEGKELVRALAPHFDVFCENFKAGTAKPGVPQKMMECGLVISLRV